MTTEENSNICAFDILFTRNVPLILEIIFFSLERDLKSFETCAVVCKSWNTLFSSESFKRRGNELRDDENSLFISTYFDQDLDPTVLNFDDMVKLGQDRNKVRNLLAKGVDPNCAVTSRRSLLGRTPLINAVLSGNVTLFYPFYKLFYTLFYNINEDMIKILLDAGADPNLSFGNHKSPLYCAVWNANPANANIVKMLLDAGADPNQG